MSLIKELRSSPFYDDYDPSLRDFLRVLFRPGRAVQARELNQLQSILQMQIERFASHIFKDGSIIFGGGTTIDTISARYLKVEDTIPNTTNEFSPAVLLNKTVKGKDSGAIALVKTYAEREGTDPKTLIIKELNGLSFQGGEVLQVVVQDSSGNYILDSNFPSTGICKLLSTNFYGKASTVSISEGIFFTKGIFVINNSQTVPLDKYSNVPNKKAGLMSYVQIVSENDDSTLLDNATGTYNYSAPGASRLKIILQLTSKDLNYTPSPDEDFIELLEVREGKLYKQISRPTYNELMKLLARRTFNESGNYTVKPFILDLQDHPTDETKLRAYLSPGLAYINGFEFETIATQWVDINKARDTDTKNNYGISVYYDNYFIVNKASTGGGLPDLSPYQQLTLKNSSNATIGSCYFRSLEHNSPTTLKIYVFGVNLTSGTITDINKITWGTSGTLTIASSPTVLYGPSNKVLVYNTGFSKVKNITDIVTIYKKKFNNVPVTGSQATISLSGNETFLSDPNNYIVVNSSNDFVTVTNVVLSGGNQIATLTLSGSNTQVTIIADVRNVNATPNIKTPIYVKTSKGFVQQAGTAVNSITLESYEPSINNYYVGCKIKLVSGTGSGSTIYTITAYNETTKTVSISGGNPDVGLDTYYEIAPAFTVGTQDPSIGYFTYTTSGTITDQDIITLSNTYDGIALIKVMTNVTSSDDWFDTSKDITYKFEFNSGQTTDFYGPCSIKLRSGYSIPSGVTLHIFLSRFTHTINSGFFCINSYPADDNSIYPFSDADGNTVDLKNCIDFRPTYTGTTFLTPALPPKAYSLFSCDLEHYLGKVVKIIATADGTFDVIEGTSSLNPTPPADVDYGMTLYVITLSPYTYNKNYTKVKYIENKRYTMRDIGKLEKRIENLEYYTSLSLLESSTASMDIRDANGNTRFKNGILVDSFDGHSIGDTQNPDYKCSIDITKKELRPLFKERAFTLYPIPDPLNNIHTNIQFHPTVATCKYTLKDFIVQNKASKTVNVNPYAVFLWRGSLTLNPSNDIWKDTRTRPTNIQNTNGVNNNLFGNTPWNTNFNEWNLNWSGTVISSTTTPEIIEEEVIEERWEPDLVPQGNLMLWIRNAGNMRLTWTDPFTGAALDSPVFVSWVTMADGSERPGSIIPARRETVARVVPRQTGNAILTQTIARPTITQSTISLGDVVASVDFIPFIRPRTITFTATGLKPNTRVYPFFEDQPVSQFVNGGSPLITDNNGSVTGTFEIPSNRFLTGERTFRLTDSPSNNREQETTYAEAKYFAIGLAEDRVTLNATVPSIGITTTTTNTRIVQPVDPLAQSFFVDPIIYPEGIFIKEVDIFFAKKDNAIPVILQIRENVNGYPSNVDILAEVLKPASDVNTTGETTFVFPNPLYLKPGEYSIVLISNSNNYEVWVAQVGEKEVNSNTLISEQPYVGSLFKSQNASTWTAEQTEDLKFTIRKCEFTTGNFELKLTDFINNATFPDIYIELPLLETVNSGASSLKIARLNERNITVGTLVEHPNITSGTKITSINYVESTITLSSTVTGTINSGSIIKFRKKIDSDEEINKMDLFKANLNVFNAFSSVNLNYSFRSKLLSSSSLETNETVFNPNANYEFTSTRRVDTADVSFQTMIKGNLSSKHVSPVINLERNYYVAVENIINNPTPLVETTPNGGNSLSRYITQKIVLEESSNYMKVFMDIYRPIGTDVKVFYRVALQSSSTPLEESSWVEMVSDSELTNLYSNSQNDFFEVSWSPSSTNIGLFNEFQIKIVMTSSNQSIVPKVKRLRVISLI